MDILCKLFGHKPPSYHLKGWWSPGEQYMKVKGSTRDGIGRFHLYLYAECPRCGQEYKVGNVHIPNEIISDFEKRIEQLNVEISDLHYYQGITQP